MLPGNGLAMGVLGLEGIDGSVEIGGLDGFAPPNPG